MPSPGPDRKAEDDAILAAIKEHYAPAVGTTHIAEEVGVRRQTVDTHLRKLWDRGLVDSMKVGKSRIWWITSSEERELADEPVDTDE